MLSVWKLQQNAKRSRPGEKSKTHKRPPEIFYNKQPSRSFSSLSQTKRVSTQNLMHFLFLSAADPSAHSQGVSGRYEMVKTMRLMVECVKYLLCNLTPKL